MWVMVVTRMSSDTILPMKESVIALVMNIYLLHQERMVIRRWFL